MPELITQAEYARRVNVTRQAVNDWVSRGVIHLVNGLVDPDQAQAAIAAAHDPVRDQRILTAGSDAPPAAKSDDDSFARARARREMAEAERAELKLARERGELAPVSVMQAALTRVAARLAAILDAVPVQIARAAPHLTRADLDVIEQQLAAARNAAADIEVDLHEVARQPVAAE